jgi:hypothetical protein
MYFEYTTNRCPAQLLIRAYCSMFSVLRIRFLGFSECRDLIVYVLQMIFVYVLHSALHLMSNNFNFIRLTFDLA